MIKVYKSNDDFLKHNLEFLMSDEIKNGLIIGIARRFNDDESHFVSSIIEDRILLGVLAGKNLIISANTLESDVYKELVRHMLEVPYPGIVSEKETALIYNKVYKELTGKEMYIDMNQRIYSCKKIISETKIKGKIRLANDRDFEGLKHWSNGFIQEVEGKIPIEESNKTLRRLLDGQTLYVLEDDNILLSMASRTRPTEKCETISYVYTPLNLRRQGYATMLVENLTRLILKDKETVTLYTDLSNPTSNSIYLKIGYKPYCDSLVLNKKI
jgi:hypothetical protein